MYQKVLQNERKNETIRSGNTLNFQQSSIDRWDQRWCKWSDVFTRVSSGLTFL